MYRRAIAHFPHIAKSSLHIMSTAHLLLCHTPPHHLPLMAQRAPQHHFYVHYDAKSDAGGIAFLNGLPNVSVLPQRIDVRWGGFSMIEATLALMQAALAQPQHQYFHLMSGDCLPLQTPETIERQMAAAGAGCLFLSCENVPRLRYRVRFSLPHADTSWQCSLTGKCLTKAAQCADRLLPSRQTAWAGSQWFSADRAALQLLLDAAADMRPFFRHKLCPDEHFFQFIAQRHAAQLRLHNDNRRCIRFAHGANHPDWQTLPQVQAAFEQGFWFVRKVRPDVMQAFWAQDGRQNPSTP